MILPWAFSTFLSCIICFSLAVLSSAPNTVPGHDKHLIVSYSHHLYSCCCCGKLPWTYGIKQHKCILLLFGRSEVQHRCHWSKVKVPDVDRATECSGRFHSLPSAASRGCPHSMSPASNHVTQNSAFRVKSSQPPVSPCSFQGPVSLHVTLTGPF